MEIEEMKTLWNEMSGEIEKQKKLTDQLIIKMIRTDYRNKIGKILIPETIGALICVAGSFFVLINLYKLDTWYLLACGIISVVILFILPGLSINSIRKLRSIHISDNNFRQSLFEYSGAKMKYVFTQKMSFYLGALLMLVFLPVMGKLVDGTDFFKATWLWYYYVIGFPFFYWFARWVSKSYRKTILDAENIIKELEV